MLRSDYCNLSARSERDLCDLGECPYDQGGYFVINGSEKVLIAQVGMLQGSGEAHSPSRPGATEGSGGGAGVGGGASRHAGRGSTVHTLPSLCNLAPPVLCSPSRGGHGKPPHHVPSTLCVRPSSPCVFTVSGNKTCLYNLQERMANNHVYVFRKSQPSKYSYVGECRCGGLGAACCGVLRGVRSTADPCLVWSPAALLLRIAARCLPIRPHRAPAPHAVLSAPPFANACPSGPPRAGRWWRAARGRSARCRYAARRSPRDALSLAPRSLYQRHWFVLNRCVCYPPRPSTCTHSPPHPPTHPPTPPHSHPTHDTGQDVVARGAEGRGAVHPRLHPLRPRRHPHPHHLPRARVCGERGPAAASRALVVAAASSAAAPRPSLCLVLPRST